jgi:hypothetical protein
MAYSRQPQVVIANGGALKQTPVPSNIQPPGIVPVEIEAEISTTANLGVVQVGSGLSITPLGVLSATNSGSNFINVKLTNVDYTATASDYYIGATKKDIDITLPLGITGRVYVIKNQISGNIEVKCTSGQKINTSSSKTLGSEDSIIVVFDGTRWNTI